MSEDRNRKYFKVVADGSAEKAIVDFKLKYADANASWFEFAKKFGATEVFAGTCIMGIMLKEDQVPEGWVSAKKLPTGCYRPQRRKVCMDAYHEFNALACKPTPFTLANMLGIEGTFTGNRISLPTFETVNGENILSLHADSEITEGLVELKVSEYWVLKEAEKVDNGEKL